MLYFNIIFTFRLHGTLRDILGSVPLITSYVMVSVCGVAVGKTI
jgi:hypothetical protein